MNAANQDEFTKRNSLFDINVKYLMSLAKNKSSFHIKLSELSENNPPALHAGGEDSLDQWRKTIALIRKNEKQ